MSFKYDLKADDPYYTPGGDVEVRIVDLAVDHPNKMLASFTKIVECGTNGATCYEMWHEHINRQLFERAIDRGEYSKPF